MSVDVHEMRSVVARVSELTGAGFDNVDSGVVLVGGIGRVGVSSVAQALRASGLSVREWADDHTSGAQKIDRADRTSDGRAGVALLILDPSSGVAGPEVELLRDLSGAASIVALVCNKIDAFWDWPTLLRVNRQILDPHGRRPIFAVSAAAALAGHLPESGFDALTEWLSEQLDPADRPERLATVAAERRLDAFIEELAAPDLGVDPAAGLMSERAAVAGTRDRGRLDRMAALRGGAGQIRGDVLGALSGATRAVAAQASEAAARMSRSGAPAFARRLEDELTQLRTRTLAHLDNELDGLQARTLLGLDDAEPVAGTRSPPPVTMPALPPPRRGAEEVLLVVFGASAGLGLGRLVVTPMASVDTLQWIAMPLTLVLGVVIAVGMVRVRRLSMLRGAMTSWAHDAVGDVRTQIEHEVARRVLSAESVIGGRLTRYYERRSSMSAGRVADLDREIRQRRQAAVARRESDLERLAAAVETRDQLDRVLAALGH
jgi:hypothetical protein